MDAKETENCLAANKVPHNAYKPTYTIGHGEILLDYMEASKINKSDLRETLCITPNEIDKFLESRRPITREIAIKLETIFGRPAHF